MCGICGEWNPAGVDESSLEQMNQALAHRGPDDQGSIVLPEVGLAMRRLSIIDLQRGHQPITNEDRTAWIVFNGEIYNYAELRRGLEARGHGLQTQSDTEVILHLYEEEGERVVHRLRGMFAFAIWDIRRRRLLLARDRFGQKPLFYSFDGRRFLFASEIKGILAAGRNGFRLDPAALDDYLTLRFVPSPGTMLQGISKLPPAHTLVLDASGVDPASGRLEGAARVEVSRYWRLRYVPKRQLREQDAVEEVRTRVTDAVASHLVSDVPVGAYLSGGMDSSLIVAMIAGLRGEGVPTFSIGVAEQDFNELPYAAEVAKHWRTDHHEEVVSPDLVRLLPTIIHHLDEPSDPIAACMYHAAALAARHVKVVLSGDGGDEIFAGYDRYAGFPWVRAYAALPAPLRRYLLGPLLRTLPDTAGYKTLTQKARWLHELSFHRGGRRYAEAHAFFRFGDRGREGLYSSQLSELLAGRDTTQCIVAAFEEAEADNDLDRMLYADVDTRLPEHALMLTDRMTMSQSLEARSPFLDHELAELVATLPADLKVKRGNLKYLMRQVAKDYLPPSILTRPKQGFMFPLGYWMKGPLLPLIRDLSRDACVVRDGIFRREAIARLVAEHLAGRLDHHVRLWMILNVELWYRMYLLGQSGEELSEWLSEQVAAGV